MALAEFTTMWKYACSSCGAIIEPQTVAWRDEEDGRVLDADCAAKEPSTP